MTSLQGKNVIVAGGTTGIGRCTAEILHAEGARLFLFGRNEKELDAALQATGGDRGLAAGTTADVSRPADVERAFAKADAFFGDPDAVICGAAVGWSLTVDSTEEDWQYVIQTNLGGVIMCGREAASRMKRRGSGHIVLLGSLSAAVKEPMGSMYVASKGGVRALAGSMRKELNPLGISVSLIEPGCTATDLHREDYEKMSGKVKEHIMMRPEDVAATVVFTLTRPPGCEIITLQVRPRMELI